MVDLALEHCHAREHNVAFARARWGTWPQRTVYPQPSQPRGSDSGR